MRLRTKSVTQEEAIGIFLKGAPILNDAVVVPAGADDCGILDFGRGLCIAVTTDYTNFRSFSSVFGVGDLSDRGRLLVFHNVSDLLATGAKPIAFLSSIALPKFLPYVDLRRLAKGISDGVRSCDMVLLGGDTKEANDIALCGVAIGIVNRRRIWGQSYVRPGDDLFLSGAVGGVSAAIWARSIPRLTREQERGCMRALLRPLLPLGLASKLRQHSFRVGARDVSDGLGADLVRLLRNSKVGALVHGERIPLPAWVRKLTWRYRVNPLEMAFGMGGDGQFAFSASRKNRRLIEGLGAVRIGEVVDGSEAWIIAEKKEMPLPDFGHRDFEEPRSSEKFLSLVGRRFEAK